jgi:hypothetical protein
MSWFTTKFGRRGVHRCVEQWHVRDVRIYIASGLCEDNNTTFVLC